MAELRMPSLGADMTHGTLVEWRVKPGDAVKRGDVVAEVETEKGVFEVDIRSDAVVEELLVAKGSKVPVGTALARLGDGVREATAVSPAMPTPAPSAVTPVPPAPTPRPIASRTRVRASPLARRMAAELGIDLGKVTPSGEGGTITRSDVERASRGNGAAPPPAGEVTQGPPPVLKEAPAASDATRMVAMRHAIGAAVAKSKREIPHYYLSQDIDVSHAVEWLRAENLRRSVDRRLLPAALLIKAVAKAAATFPEFNGFWVDDSFQTSADVHVGVAIALRGGGLIAPALHLADKLSLDEVMRALTDLVQRTRGGGLRTSELTDATLTVTNLGDLGVQSVFGVIYPPQVAIVGFGAIAEKPWAHEGLLGVRPIITATLAADHRASDGHRGGQFLADIAGRLADPEAL